VLSTNLSKVLAIRVGDSVEVELLETGVTKHAVVSAFIDELMSPNAYTDLAAAATLVGEQEQATGAYLRLDRSPDPALFERLRAMPRVMSVSSRIAMLEQFDRMMARGFRTTAAIVVIFAAVIALGVVYNGARISLSERGRELASLRVLGFTTREVGAMLLGEQAILTLLAIPLGWGLGRIFAGYLATAFESEHYQVPIVTLSSTYLFASAVVLTASALAGVLMYRRTTRLDLVAVLKTRE
jgi:putative ABC transport system permease protein